MTDNHCYLRLVQMLYVLGAVAFFLSCSRKAFQAANLQFTLFFAQISSKVGNIRGWSKCFKRCSVAGVTASLINLFIYLFRHTTTSTLCSVAILIEVMMTTIIERYYGWETGRI